MSCRSSWQRRHLHGPWNFQTVLLDARLPGNVTLVTVRTTVGVVITTGGLNIRNIHPEINKYKRIVHAKKMCALRYTHNIQYFVPVIILYKT